MRKRKGRSTALFLVFCMVLSMMSAIPARAAWDEEDRPYGLLAAEELEVYDEMILVNGNDYPAYSNGNWSEDGVPEAGEDISYTDQKDAYITGSYLWLEYSASGDAERTHITTENIIKVEYSDSDGDSAEWEEIQDTLTEDQMKDQEFQTYNGGTTELVWFKPGKVGYYRFTCEDSMEDNEKLIVHVDYPGIGFYSAPSKTEENFLSSVGILYNNYYEVNYDELIENGKLANPNEIYVNLYNDDEELTTGDCNLHIWGEEDVPAENVSDYITVEKVSETEESGWYKIIFEKALISKEGFDLDIKGVAALNGSFPQSGLLALDWLDRYEVDGCETILVGEDGPVYHAGWDDNSPIPGAPVEYTDRIDKAVIADSALWIDYIDSGKKTPISAEDITVEYSETDPDAESEGEESEDAELKSEIWEEKQNLIEPYHVQTSDGEGRDLVLFKPDEPGYYRFSCAQCEDVADNMLILHVDYPEIGFYSAHELDKKYLYPRNIWNNCSNYIGSAGEEAYTIYMKWNNRDNATGIDSLDYRLEYYCGEEEGVVEDSFNNAVNDFMSVENLDDDWYKITFNEAFSSGGSFFLEINGVKSYEDGHTEDMYDSLDGSIRQLGLYVTCDGEDLHSGEDWLNYAGGIAPGEVELRFGNFTKDEETGKIKEEDLDLNEGEFTIEARRFGEEEADFHEAIQGKDCTYEVTDDGTLKIMSYYQQLYRITINGESVYTHPYLNLIEFFGTPKRPDDPEKIEIENHICTTANVDEGKTDTIYVMPYVDDEDPEAVNMTTLEIEAKTSKDEQSVENYIDVEPVVDSDGTTIGQKITITDKAAEDFYITVTAKQNNEDETSATLFVDINKRSSLEVATLPKKTVYTEGETFDPTGMEVKLVYEDGKKEPVKIEDCTITPAGALKTTDKSVTISYLGKTTTQEITVKEKQQPTTEQPTTQQPTTQQPTTQAAKPSAKGTVLSSQKAGEKAEFTVTSDNGANPTVAYKKTTDKKEKTVKVPNTVEVNGVTYKVTSIADNAFKGNKTITKVTVGSNITSIGKNAFASCTKLKSITIPKNVTTVGDNAFKGCTALTKVTLPAKTKKVGKNAFYGCKKISKVTFKGTSVTKIGDGAFRKCSALKSVSIPKNVTEIGKDAFRDCKKLKTVSIKGTKLKKIGKNVFKNLPKNVTIKVPKKKKAAYKKLLKKAGYKGKVK